MSGATLQRRCTTVRRPRARSRRCEELLADGDADRVGRANVSGISPGSSRWSVSSRHGRSSSIHARGSLRRPRTEGCGRAYRGPCSATSSCWRVTPRPPGVNTRHCAGICEESGELGLLSTYAADLAESLRELDDDAGAEHWSRISEGHAASDDVSAQFAWRAARATVLARRGELEEAERLARQAVEFGGPHGCPQQARRGPALPRRGASPERRRSRRLTRRSLRRSRSTSERETSPLVGQRREAPLGASRPNSLLLHRTDDRRRRRACRRGWLTRRAGTPLTSQPARATSAVIRRMSPSFPGVACAGHCR